MKTHAKLDEVALRAGVSSATVSRVLNGGVVKTSTRDRVLQVISELKYQPNLAARDLAGGSSRTLGVIVSNLENPFFFDIYHALESDAHAGGYEVVMANTDYRPEQLAASVHLMIGRRVAGLAAIVSEMDGGVLEELRASKLPAVYFEGEAAQPRIASIRVNYRAGMERVVAYLYSLGHRRLGFLGHHDALDPLKQRRSAVLNAVGRYESLQVRAVEGIDTLEGGYHSMNHLLSSDFAPTAVVCVNDITAVGALRALREAGVRVPREVSVVGFDNIRLSEFCFPALTTVHVPRDRIGHMIFDRLMRWHDLSRIAEQDIVIEPELLVRDSSGPAPANGDRKPERSGVLTCAR